MLSEYNKTITALITGLIGWASSVVVSDPAKITAGEWVQFATVLAVGLGVYAVTNTVKDVPNTFKKGQSMAASITQNVNDTHKTIEDKVRKLPANQGKNEYDMWVLIDAEVAQSISDNKISLVYAPRDKHGSK